MATARYFFLLLEFLTFGEVEWGFGTGLSYSTFAITDLKLSKTEITSSDTLTVSVVVTNTGLIQSKYTVLLFITDVYRRITPEYKLLKRFLICLFLLTRSQIYES